MDIYQQNILDYYKHPRCHSKIDYASHHGEASNPLCGDRLEFHFKIENNKVKEIGWSGEGCVLSQAAADMLAEYLKNKTLPQMQAVNKDVLLKMVGVELGPNRIKCALLPLDALRQSLN